MWLSRLVYRAGSRSPSMWSSRENPVADRRRSTSDNSEWMARNVAGSSTLRPEDWDAAVKDWHSRNAALVRHQNGRRLRSRSHEYMLYQALVGAWPGKTNTELAARMQNYAVKAAREGKEETNWTDPNEAYEAALRTFVAGLLDPTISAGLQIGSAHV